MASPRGSGIALLIVLLPALLLGAPSQAAELSSHLLYWLPRESGEVAFVDLKELRISPHYSLLKQRLLPSRLQEFEQFLKTAGIRVEEDVDWLGWALIPPVTMRPSELFLGFAHGRFATGTVERFYQAQQLPTDVYRGQTLFSFGDHTGADAFYFAFPDSSTAVFGTRTSLELLLETRWGTHDNLLRNQKLYAQISETNGRAPVWVVLNDHYTRLAVRQLLPEVAKFEQFSSIAERLRSAQLRVEWNKEELRVQFDTQCQGALDAQIFSLLVGTALELQGWRTKKSDPLLFALLENTQVRPIGDRLEIRVAAEEQQVRALLERPRTLF